MIAENFNTENLNITFQDPHLAEEFTQYLKQAQNKSRALQNYLRRLPNIQEEQFAELFLLLEFLYNKGLLKELEKIETIEELFGELDIYKNLIVFDYIDLQTLPEEAFTPGEALKKLTRYVEHNKDFQNYLEYHFKRFVHTKLAMELPKHIQLLLFYSILIMIAFSTPEPSSDIAMRNIIIYSLYAIAGYTVDKIGPFLKPYIDSFLNQFPEG